MERFNFSSLTAGDVMIDEPGEERFVGYIHHQASLLETFRLLLLEGSQIVVSKKGSHIGYVTPECLLEILNYLFYEDD